LSRKSMVMAVAMGKITQNMGTVIAMVPPLWAWQAVRVAAAMGLVPLLRTWRVGMVKAMGRRVSVATPMVVPALVARKKVDDASFQNGMTLR